MRQLSGELLLTALDLGAQDTYLGRILTMLALVHPEISREQIAAWSLQDIIIELLTLRAISFGPELAGYLACPACGARLEFTLPIPPVVESLQESKSIIQQRCAIGETNFTMRPVTAADLFSVTPITDLPSARKRLLASCIRETNDEGTDKEIYAELERPDFMRLAIRAFEQLQSSSEISIDLQCAECSRAHAIDLDLGRFVWTEVRHAASRLMREVHELASAYGWQEASILAMSSNRRNAYLEMAR
jgi:hypothetical protein